VGRARPPTPFFPGPSDPLRPSVAWARPTGLCRRRANVRMSGEARQGLFRQASPPFPRPRSPSSRRRRAGRVRSTRFSRMRRCRQEFFYRQPARRHAQRRGARMPEGTAWFGAWTVRDWTPSWAWCAAWRRTRTPAACAASSSSSRPGRARIGTPVSPARHPRAVHLRHPPRGREPRPLPRGHPAHRGPAAPCGHGRGGLPPVRLRAGPHAAPRGPTRVRGLRVRVALSRGGGYLNLRMKAHVPPLPRMARGAAPRGATLRTPPHPRPLGGPRRPPSVSSRRPRRRSYPPGRPSCRAITSRWISLVPS
jgi:hypothetical protein